MLAVGSRNEAALAVIATATVSRPAGMRCWPAACRATGMATTTATSRLTSPLSRAVNASTEAAATARGAWSRISRRASAPNTPSLRQHRAGDDRGQGRERPQRGPGGREQACGCSMLQRPSG